MDFFIPPHFIATPVTHQQPALQHAKGISKMDFYPTTFHSHPGHTSTARLATCRRHKQGKTELT